MTHYSSCTVDIFLFRTKLKVSLFCAIFDFDTMVIKVLSKAKAKLSLKRMRYILPEVVNIDQACKI